MLFDLHCHTTASDGDLAPQALVELARDRGISHLSITDHDTVAAYQGIAPPPGLTLVPGVEFSTTWGKVGIHILGLNIDPLAPSMQEAVACQGAARRGRAERIAEKLAKLGVEAPLEGASQQAGGGAIGRPHFARHLVASGFVKSEEEAFRKYLGAGKAGDIRQHWAESDKVIDWIRGAGGSAVLAHPAKYGLTRARLLSLAQAFKGWGGQGLEVVSGTQTPTVTRDLASLCTELDLAASWGSDFHRPGQSWAELGRYSTPPGHLRPLWQHW